LRYLSTFDSYNSWGCLLRTDSSLIATSSPVPMCTPAPPTCHHTPRQRTSAQHLRTARAMQGLLSKLQQQARHCRAVLCEPLPRHERRLQDAGPELCLRRHSATGLTLLPLRSSALHCAQRAVPGVAPRGQLLQQATSALCPFGTSVQLLRPHHATTGRALITFAPSSSCL